MTIDKNYDIIVLVTVECAFYRFAPKNDDITKMKNEVAKHQMSLIGVLSMFFMPRTHSNILRKCQNARVVYVEAKCK